MLHTKNLSTPTVLAVNTENEILSEQLATSFRVRQASASYQEMLVSQSDYLVFFFVHRLIGSTQPVTHRAIS